MGGRRGTGRRICRFWPSATRVRAAHGSGIPLFLFSIFLLGKSVSRFLYFMLFSAARKRRSGGRRATDRRLRSAARRPDSAGGSPLAHRRPAVTAERTGCGEELQRQGHRAAGGEGEPLRQERRAAGGEGEPLRQERGAAGREGAGGRGRRRAGYAVPIHRQTMPSRTRARSTAFDFRFRSLNNRAAPRNDTTTLPRRTIDTTEIRAPGWLSA